MSMDTAARLATGIKYRKVRRHAVSTDRLRGTNDSFRARIDLLRAIDEAWRAETATRVASHDGDVQASKTGAGLR